MKEKKFYLQRYTVAGRGEFPLTMLWVDEAFPWSNVDIKPISDPAGKEDRYVQLGRYATNKRKEPDSKLWFSYGWRIVNYSIQTL